MFHIGNEKLIEKLQDFYVSSQVVSLSVGQTQPMRKLFLEFQLSSTKLESSLALPWNAELPIQEGASVTDPNSESSKTTVSAQGSNSNVLDMVEDEPTKVDSTKIKFIRLSPKVDIGQSYVCESLSSEIGKCGRKYSTLKALKKHCKEKHGGEGVSKELNEYRDTVTCKMCFKSFERSQMVRHLKLVHKWEKKPSQVFRGYQTIDDGRRWLPLFVEKGESDPNFENEVEIPVIDGKFMLNGVAVQLSEYLDVSIGQNVEIHGDVLYVSPTKSSMEKRDAVPKGGLDEKFNAESDYLVSTPVSASCEPVTENSVVTTHTNDSMFIEKHDEAKNRQSLLVGESICSGAARRLFTEECTDDNVNDSQLSSKVKDGVTCMEEDSGRV